MDQKRNAVAEVKSQLNRYVQSSSPCTGGGGKWRAIKTGDPLHAAVVALEQCFPRKELPRDCYRAWKKLLAESRQSDPSVVTYGAGMAAWEFGDLLLHLTPKRAFYSRRSTPIAKPLTARQSQAIEAWSANDGKVAQAAKKLGIARASFMDRLKGARRKLPVDSMPIIQQHRGRRSRLPTDNRGGVGI